MAACGMVCGVFVGFSLHILLATEIEQAHSISIENNYHNRMIIVSLQLPLLSLVGWLVLPCVCCLAEICRLGICIGSISIVTSKIVVMVA